MPKLVIQDGVEAGREIELNGRIVLGREGEWAIKDTKISRQHSRVFPDGDAFVVADLNSRNGTLVNGARVSRHTLENGDVIRIGNTSLVFSTGEPPEVLAGPEVLARPAPAAAAPPAITPKPRGHPAAAPPATPTKAPAPLAAAPVGQIIWTDKGERSGAFWEDLGQRNFAYKAGMVLLAVAVAVAVFYGVSVVSEQLFG